MESSNPKNEATRSYMTAATEFESIERILLYLRTTNSIINEDVLNSLSKLKTYNNNIEIPFEIDQQFEREFLDINYFENTLSTMMYVKTVDNFETYFKDILSEIVLSDPRILKSKETEPLDFILSFSDYESLVNGIAEKKIESLFYQNIEGIQKFFRDRVGVEVFEGKTEEINLLVKQRNLAVHNRSKISTEFVKQFPNYNFEIGKVLNFTFDYVHKLVPALNKIINDLDYKFTDKFKLKLIEY